MYNVRYTVSECCLPSVGNALDSKFGNSLQSVLGGTVVLEEPVTSGKKEKSIFIGA